MDPSAITYFGETDSRNKKIRFGIKAKDRLRHVYVIGKTGMGKSTLLENMAIQDIQNGNGVAVIDPHGSMAEKLLDYVPEHRVKDVLYFAPFDLEYPVSFNVMEDIGADKRHLVVNGLMSTFEKIWVDAWSARMAYILNNTLLALLEYPGATLLGVNRMLADKEYRKKIVENVKDPSVKSFWIEEFGKYTEKFAAEATPAIQNKIGQFTSNPLVRNLIGQSKSSFDIRKFMDEKKILIINLSKGRVGEGNANLIGSMLITKIYLAAMSRADVSESDLAKLPNFYLYVDEFQSFANKSFADILSEARKYKLNLTIAHQYIEQMEEEVRDAVFGNVGTMITFRVGAFDAEVLEKEFAPIFTAEDLVNLGFTQIYLKLMIDGVSSQPFSATTMGPIARPEISFKDAVIESSRKQFASTRGEVEKSIIDWHAEGTQPPPPKPATNPNHSSSSNGFKNQVVNSGNRSSASFNINNNDGGNAKDSSNINTNQNSSKEDPNKIAFLKAKELLESKQKIVDQKVTDVSDKPISLSALKRDESKKPTNENLSNLKNALADVLKKTQEVTQDKKQENKQDNITESKKEDNKEEKPKNSNSNSDSGSNARSHNHTHTNSNEIPESVLREVLELK
jgi:hypothetical protein